MPDNDNLITKIEIYGHFWDMTVKPYEYYFIDMPVAKLKDQLKANSTLEKAPQTMDGATNTSR